MSLKKTLLLWWVLIPAGMLWIRYRDILTIREGLGILLAFEMVWLVLVVAGSTVRLGEKMKQPNVEDTDPEWTIPILWRCPRCAVVIEQKGESVECPVCGRAKQNMIGGGFN